MEFEEYKSLQEKFTPIDSAEKLGHVRQMYQNWLAMQEDLKHLEPIENELKDEFAGEKHYQIIESTFNPLQLGNGELNILVIPSFNNPYQIKFSNEEVSLTFAKQKLWSKPSPKNKSNVKIKSIKLETKSEERFSVIEMAKKLIRSARKPLGTFGTLDGVRYYFIYKEENHLHIAFKNLGDGYSPVFELIARIEFLIEDKRDLLH